MTAALRHHQHSYAEYLVLERDSLTKHEYLDGEIYAMSGGSLNHAALTAAVSGTLFNQLRGRSCRVFSSDLRVRVMKSSLATYPDLSVVCGTPQLDPDSDHTVLNPTLLVEVLSPSTERYDRSVKLEHYRQIPTLREYVLLSHRESLIEVWRRENDDTWQLHRAAAGETMALPSIECSLMVDDVYHDLLPTVA